MKLFFKWLSGFFLATLVLTGGWAMHEWYAQKPFSFRMFVEREFLKYVSKDPQFLTGVGLERIGIREHNSKLSSGYQASILEKVLPLTEIRSGVLSYTNLTEQEQLTKDVVLYMIDRLEELEKFKYHNYPLDTFSGLHQQYQRLMTAQHPMNSLEDVEQYIDRLDASSDYFNEVISSMKFREENSITPPRVIIEKVLAELEYFISSPVVENELYSRAQHALNSLEEITENDKQAILKRVGASINQHVYPAYKKLIDYYAYLHPVASNDIGYWRLPEGDKAYAALLKFFTTTDYTPEQVFQFGINEVKRLQHEILKELNKQNFSVQGEFAEVLKNFTSKSEFYFPDNDEGKKQLLQQMSSILKDINEQAADVFNVQLPQNIPIEPYPKSLEANKSLGAMNGGKFMINLGDMKALPKFSMHVLAYHEGTPGHYLQDQVQKQLKGVPTLRKMMPFGAYGEGWGMYAEQLPRELGINDSPSQKIGYYLYDLERAGRLVIDAGIHVKRWSHEQAVNYLMNETAQSRKQAEIEVNRAIVVPGSGPMYKIGYSKILELREKTKLILGSNFNLAEFHDVILGNGPLPLEMLEIMVNQYINEKLNPEKIM